MLQNCTPKNPNFWATLSKTAVFSYFNTKLRNKYCSSLFSKLHNPASEPDALAEDAGLHDRDGRDGNNEEHNPDSNVSHFAINQIFSENYDQLHNQKQMTN